MNIYYYIIFAAVYIMTIHFAIAIRNEFNTFLMIGLFVLGGTIGYFMNSYELGFTLSIVLSLVFW
jgi:hypothetical protein